MFKLNPNPTFRADVALSVAGEDAQTVTFIFKHMRRKDLDKWIRRPAEAAQQGTALDDCNYLAEVIQAWDGVYADDGTSSIEYTPDALGQLLNNYPAAGHEIFNAYVKALTESRAKN